MGSRRRRGTRSRRELGAGQPIVTRPAGYAVDLAPGALDLEAALSPSALQVALERGRRTGIDAAVELARAAARSRSA